MAPVIIFREKPHMPEYENGAKGKSKNKKTQIPMMMSIHFEGSVSKFSWQPGILNRVVAQDPHNFVHISFAELSFNGIGGRNKSIRYIEEVLKHGVEIEDQLFLYCGQSNSQLKSRSCFLYAANTLLESATVIHGLGSFTSIKNVGKRAKRIGLLFSSSEHIFQLNIQSTAEMKDVEREGNVFTDGCGLISEEFAIEITKKIKTNSKSDISKNYIPKVFQIRYKGCKGILMVAKDKDFKLASGENPNTSRGLFQNIISWFRQVQPSASEGHKSVVFRESMRKFENCPIDDFCVLEYSKPVSSGKLNGELVSILSTLGISDEIFLKKQNEYFAFIAYASRSLEGARNFLEYRGRSDLVTKLIAVQQLESVPVYILNQIKALQKDELRNSFDRYDMERVHIRIPDSRLLYGVCDISGKLSDGQCFVRITTDRNSLTTKTLAGPVIVGRNPCLYPGDIQIFNAVDSIPELDHLQDCIVFSTMGSLPPASLMSGGDLDGDKFFVCWDKDLRPSKCETPLDYSLLQPEVQIQETIGPLDMIKYFAQYSTSLGEVMELYWAWIRGNSKKRASSKQCVHLSKLYSKCVDGESVIIPGHLKNTPTPDNSNPFILDTLKNNLKNSFDRKFDNFLGSTEPGDSPAWESQAEMSEENGSADQDNQGFLRKGFRILRKIMLSIILWIWIILCSLALITWKILKGLWHLCQAILKSFALLKRFGKWLDDIFLNAGKMIKWGYKLATGRQTGTGRFPKTPKQNGNTPRRNLQKSNARGRREHPSSSWNNNGSR